MTFRQSASISSYLLKTWTDRNYENIRTDVDWHWNRFFSVESRIDRVYPKNCTILTENRDFRLEPGSRIVPSRPKPNSAFDRRYRWIPVPRKPPLIFWEVKALSWAYTNAASHFTFWIRFIFVRISSSILAAMCLFNALNIPTSSGWVKWEECGGKIAIMILLSIQYPTHSPVIWLSWPS